MKLADKGISSRRRIVNAAGYLFSFVLFFTSCTPSSFATQGIGTLIPTRNPSSSSSNAQIAVVKFMEAWQTEDYRLMYDLITRVSRDAISREDFEKKYRDTAQNLGYEKLEGTVLSVMPNGLTAQVNTRVVFKTAVFGDFKREIVMNVTHEDNEWRIQWEDGLILPELHGGNRLSSEYAASGRGDIYDNNGAPIATQVDAIAIGLKPAELLKPQEGNLLVALTKLTGRTSESILNQLNQHREEEYVPISEVTAQAAQQMSEELGLLRGLVMTPFRGRFYFEEGIAPQAVGYLLKISPEQLEEYRRKGYSGEEKVGASGLEAWAEPQLAGIRGGSVYVLDPKGNILTRLANSDSKSPEYMYTTIDKDLQIQAQRSMEGYKGAIVVMERDTGKILAMVSSPGFDSNLFETTNFNSSVQMNETLNDSSQRLLNRATQGAYPLGSIFKIVTMAAALDSGIYKPTTIYDCGYRFTELPGNILYDWTYTYKRSPSGKIDLIGGLVRSCNPYFWHIGLDLYRQGHTLDVINYARGFGLGKATGIKELDENPGQLIEPHNEGDAVQMAIGQGTMLVTPLQTAVMISAVGNGGALYRPQIVSKFTSPDGEILYSATPEVVGRIPVKPQTMDIIRGAMRKVVTDEHGTAQVALAGIQVPIYAKTGTASTAEIEPHSWFAGYTDGAAETKKPDITVVVLAENAGEGSMVAAPIFRRIIEIYYSGRPSKLFPWEVSLYVTRPAAPTAVPTLQDNPPPLSPIVTLAAP
ncbi:MAG TPA: penicillin-binding transpeptidase domain-containing protein [Leptolinea sp.]